MAENRERIEDTDDLCGMWLVIGGAAQGKLDYAKKQHPQAEVFDESSFLLLCAEESDERVIWNHFHLCVKGMLEKGLSEAQIKEQTGRVLEAHPQAVVICDEIGNGIVPVGKLERSYRDIVGRLLIDIAKESERVVRILCGIPSRIK